MSKPSVPATTVRLRIGQDLHSGKLFRDGDQWCILVGECMMPPGRVWFADTREAVLEAAGAWIVEAQHD